MVYTHTLYIPGYIHTVCIYNGIHIHFVYIIMTALCCYKAETTTTLENNYPPI